MEDRLPVDAGEVELVGPGEFEQGIGKKEGEVAGEACDVARGHGVLGREAAERCERGRGTARMRRADMASPCPSMATRAASSPSRLVPVMQPAMRRVGGIRWSEVAGIDQQESKRKARRTDAGGKGHERRHP